MCYLVRHHVVDQMRRHLYEAPIEVYTTAAVAASPARAGARKQDFRCEPDAEELSVVRDTRLKTQQRLIVQPLLYFARHGRFRRFARVNDQVGALNAHTFGTRDDLQGEGLSEQHYTLAVAPALCRRTPDLPFVEFPQHPLAVLLQK